MLLLQGLAPCRTRVGVINITAQSWASVAMLEICACMCGFLDYLHGLAPFSVSQVSEFRGGGV